MKMIINISNLKNVKLPIEVKTKIKEILFILDEEYGEEREVTSLGGYVLLVETEAEAIILKNNEVKGILPEYTDEVVCSEGVNYTSSLFLLSSDYSVVVIAEEKLSKILLEE